MDASVLFFCLIFGSVYSFAYNSTELNSSSLTRNGRFWGIGIVRFANSLCAAHDGAQGTCYTKRQCYEIGGVPAGRCAANIGVCCVVNKSCGASSSYNNTYFVSGSFPTTVSAPLSCPFTIKKCGAEICQVRIDFLNFNLAQPDGNGTCCVDAFVVVGGASIIPPICGDNSGAHIYVDFNGAQDIKLLVQLGAASTQSRSWKIKISQIDCECPTRAPSGCLQYYTATSGTVQSLNYGQAAGSSTNASGVVGTRQIANTNYGICVAMTPGFCSITWSPAAGDPFAFTVSGDTTVAIVNGTIGTANAYINGTNCTGDFVIIPNGSVNGVPALVDRYCGNSLPTITTSSKPFVLTAVTNSTEGARTSGNRGFKLSYTQNACNTACATCGNVIL